MTYFEDLTPYTYFSRTNSLLNVGWLDSSHEFSRGPVSEQFALRLGKLVQNPVCVTRGYHYCNICKPPLDIIEKNPDYQFVWEMNRRGNSEVRIQDKNGVCYAAPTLIWHYVMDHQYQPPEQFIDAVIWAVGNPNSQPTWLVE